MKKLLSIALLAVLVAAAGVYLTACGSDDGGTTTTTSNAGVQASAISGSIQLSTTVGTATGMAAGAIPSSYAPGKRAIRDTSAIAGIDPRMKDVVDKMLAQLANPLIQQQLSKARSYKTLSEAPRSATTSTTACSTGNMIITADIVTGATTTATLSMQFNDCRTLSTNEVMNGSLNATVTSDLSGAATTTVTATNLTRIIYTDSSYETKADTFVLNGTFTNINNISSGSNSSSGTFTVTNHSSQLALTFNFGSANQPVTDVWSVETVANGRLTTNTGNGAFTLGITAPNVPNITVTVSLSDLAYKALAHSNGDKDEWFSGSISLSSIPDLSSYGCAGGTFAIATSQNTPVHTPFLSDCPTSGQVTINAITIKYGNPSGTKVTVTGGGGSITYNDCSDFDDAGSMCGGSF